MLGLLPEPLTVSNVESHRVERRTSDRALCERRADITLSRRARLLGVCVASGRSRKRRPASGAGVGGPRDRWLARGRSRSRQASCAIP